MLNLIKPLGLKRGDKVATVSLSWGGAGDENILWRYKQDKKRLKEEFGLRVIEMENTLKGTEYLYNHPEKRAEELITFLPALLMPVLGDLGFAGSTFSDADFGVFGILIGKIISFFQ